VRRGLGVRQAFYAELASTRITIKTSAEIRLHLSVEHGFALKQMEGMAKRPTLKSRLALRIDNAKKGKPKRNQINLLGSILLERSTSDNVAVVLCG
jgi:hypothetical protein